MILRLSHILLLQSCHSSTPWKALHPHHPHNYHNLFTISMILITTIYITWPPTPWYHLFTLAQDSVGTPISSMLGLVHPSRALPRLGTCGKFRWISFIFTNSHVLQIFQKKDIFFRSKLPKCKRPSNRWRKYLCDVPGREKSPGGHGGGHGQGLWKKVPLDFF